MKLNQRAGRCILACLFIYFIIQIVYLSCETLPSAAGKAAQSLVCLFLAQSILFAASILAVFIVMFLQYIRKERASPFDALVLVSGEGKIQGEVLLQNKRSAAITGSKRGRKIFVEGGNIEPDRYLYGILNMVSGSWYLEAVSSKRPVGLRRGEENVIYRLKEEIPYRLFAGDVIYVDTFKIIVRKQKHLEESKWV